MIAKLIEHKTALKLIALVVMIALVLNGGMDGISQCDYGTCFPAD